MDSTAFAKLTSLPSSHLFSQNVGKQTSFDVAGTTSGFSVRLAHPECFAKKNVSKEAERSEVEWVRTALTN